MSDNEPKPVEAVQAPADPAPATEGAAPEAAAEAKPDTAPANPANEENGSKDAKDSASDEKPGQEAKKAPTQYPEGMLRVSGRKAANEQDHSKNVKSDLTSLPETDDPKEIRKQVHFYFSDSNLPSDAFLLKLTGGEENKPVELSTITSFKRMRRFQPRSAVIAALKESDFLDIEGDEGSETLRRKVPYKAKEPKDAEKRSIYAKGFGNEESSTQFDIEAFFTQFGQFNSVRLRRGDNKYFKGSVFVEWTDQETADKFLALDPKPQWKGHPLLIMSKLDYMNEKLEDIRLGKIQPQNSFRGNHRGNHHGGDRGRGRGRGGFKGDPDNWKKRRDDDQRNGFKDNRGGRGRGRGRGNHNGRGRDRNDSGRSAPQQEPADDREVGPPTIHTAPSSKADGKRAREDDGGATEPPAKKVDQKEAAPEAA